MMWPLPMIGMKGESPGLGEEFLRSIEACV